jgi:hypothetical protein
MGLAWEIHRTVPEALEEWSARRVSSEDPAIRRNAVAIRYVLYPGDSADVAHAVLAAEDEPLLVGTITFLRGHAAGDPRISRALRERLRAAAGGSCNDRLRLVDALGRQGDEIAELALVQFAATGRIRLR